MDWAKAKTILIVILLFLNGFLFYTIINANSNNKATDYNRLALEYLNSRNIVLKADFSDVPATAGRIEYETRNLDLNRISMSVLKTKINPVSTGDSIIYTHEGRSIELTDEELIIKDRINDENDLINDQDRFLQMIYTYITGLGYSKDEISLEYQKKSGEEIELGFLLKYKDALLFDHEIKASLDKSGMLSLVLPNKKVKRHKVPTEVISAYQILVMAGLPEGSVVESVDFGYRQLVEDEFYDTPVWRILIEGCERPIFYNACTGEKIKD
ncbi:MAG: hypothetical protein GX184_03235 [Clostridiaceae bacterium]|nr:hypothetical protein [Clostridiaceae bacterium]